MAFIKHSTVTQKVAFARCVYLCRGCGHRDTLDADQSVSCPRCGETMVIDHCLTDRPETEE
jgi:ribosomal protein S27E